eukprot:Blabericola_migrator_1__2582@NODE_172_length_12094_cov_159_438181_g149_i0_p14_GENE_NODE_172_length_12094_cov_159_438181_g149_i0NODE_172_length_12094_cov_159_438181_g149_i0_p14_ORF_typecomplete_len123_score17_50CBM_48/PF02922_18/0_0034_NODE_172_length_12094_cov_159_438181_g149_i0986610234
MVSWQGYGPQIQPLGCTIKPEGSLEFGLWVPHVKKAQVVLSNGKVVEMTPSAKPEMLKCIVPLNDWRPSAATDGTGGSMSEADAVTYHYELEPTWNDCFASEGPVLKRRKGCLCTSVSVWFE